MIVKGKILISIPSGPLNKTPPPSSDKNLAILIYQHDEFGAFGFNLNCILPHEFLTHLTDYLNIHHYDSKIMPRVYYGGMHELHQGIILHTKDYKSESTTSITEDLALTNSTSLLRKISTNSGPEKSLIILGHTRFLPGQLDAELLDHRWLIVDPKPNLVFTPHAWSDAIIHRGLNPALFQIHNCTGNA